MFQANYSSHPCRYTYHLQARCDSGALLRSHPSGTHHQNSKRPQGYNLPDWYSFGNISPSINNNGNVAFKVLGAWNQAIWYGTERTGHLVYVAPKGTMLGKVSLNNHECLVWEQLRSPQNGLWMYEALNSKMTHLTPGPIGSCACTSPTLNDSGAVGFRAEQLRSPQNGIWMYEALNSKTTHLTPGPIGSCACTSPTLNDSGAVGFRAKFADSYGFAAYSATPSTTTSILALMSNLDSSSIYSFLFLPAFNNKGQIAAKVRLGQPGDIGNERPDQIRIFDLDGDSTLVVSNQSHDTDSAYQSFDNSIGFNDHGQIAFTATLSSGQRGIFRMDGKKTELIAIEGDGQISQIERFPPRLNNNGLAVFRAFDTEGLRAIWAGDGTRLHKVVTQGDIVPTDLGVLRLARPDNGPVFSGLPDVNDLGDIVFAASLSDLEDVRIGFGAGLFVARQTSIPVVPRDLDNLRYVPEQN